MILNAMVSVSVTKTVLQKANTKAGIWYVSVRWRMKMAVVDRKIALMNATV